MTTILLAEDDLDDQELLAEAFAQVDPTVRLLSFTTGRNILAYLDGLGQHQLPRIIIVDYNIPEINGAEILKELDARRKFDGITKLVWSTSSSPQYENRCLRLGASAYLVKPSSIAGLTELARRMLALLPSNGNA